MNQSDVYSDDLYAKGPWRKARRAIELGWHYYLWSVPRYLLQRRALHLPLLDVQAMTNPILEMLDQKCKIGPLPDGYDDALRRLRAAGLHLSLPPSRAAALFYCWQEACTTRGDVIECGSYRGATALMIALLGKIQGRHQKVLMLDTFNGSPVASRFDSLRNEGEYAVPSGHLDRLRQQIESLGVEDRVEIWAGTFNDSFRILEGRSPRFSFAHIDANLYQSTLDACRFVVPRVVPGGTIVFDDYHGPCDLGARLAIDFYFSTTGHRPRRLAGTSAYLKVEGTGNP